MEKPWTRNVLGVASLTRTLDGTLVLAEVDERSRKTGPVRDAREEDLRRLVKLVLEALLANLENVRDVGHRQEVLHVVQAVRLRVRVRELGVDLGFTERLACHLEVTDEVVVFACAAGDLDDLGVVRGILRLDVRVCKRVNNPICRARYVVTVPIASLMRRPSS